MNRYLSAIIILAALTGNNGLQAQSLKPAPRLVVNIIIDQLRTDYIEHFSPLYTPDGFRKLLNQGCVYEAARYTFSPVDRASAIASINTGSTPQYNNIVGTQWLDRATLRPVYCTDDDKYGDSPQKLSTSTIGDELKVATRGTALVYSIALDKDAAILAGGHAADGAIWINGKNGRWTTSTYYSEASQNLIKAYNSTNKYAADNDAVADFSLSCVNDMAMGRDDITDMLSVVLSAKGKDEANWQTEMEILYLKLDKIIATLVRKIEDSVGSDKVLFMLTGTGYTDNEPVDYQKYRIPTGTFYINRTANLLNMYLGAIYGQGKYVETCYHNQIYINRKLLEQRHISFSDVISRSKELLTQAAGVRNVTTSPYNPSVSGDLLIEVAPGWKLLNEDTQENYMVRAAFVPFPIIFYGAGIKAEHVSTPATVDRIAPTIAKAIRIRAPNACSVAPLR
ncbi:alkaline phosphatase family protein [Leyella lascolaii]|uniref:alkaline phosphatase family protein n=1 Tax=Leyella lascolaii TaxID=1776379 RepID=UPI00083B26F5|nr:alkaline phosphatase family protein [Leyella lascolaii]